jgi:hypothetical protein
MTLYRDHCQFRTASNAVVSSEGYNGLVLKGFLGTTDAEPEDLGLTTTADTSFDSDNTDPPVRDLGPVCPLPTIEETKHEREDIGDELGAQYLA